MTLEPRSLVSVLSDAGGTGRLAASLDWSASSLGPMSSWPASLVTAVGICFSSPMPMLIGWGPDLGQVYNEAFRPILGDKHPQAIGRPWSESWAEIWHVVGPSLQDVLRDGSPTRSDDQRLLVSRIGFLEEAFFTFSFSPIWDESGRPGGVFCAAIETTRRVLGERRSGTLGRLAERVMTTDGVDTAAQGALETIAGNPADLPFAALYLLSEGVPVLSAVTGVDAGQLPLVPVAGLVDGLQVVTADGLTVTTAVATPLLDPSQADPVALLVTGLSPLLPYDDDYAAFVAQVAGYVGSALSAARAQQAERDRLEALAALDRAKTEFFSNVSHEFRTPLTLLLGPLEESLRGSQLDPVQRARLDTAYSNAKRLLKLVNTLLDVSRVEAGKLEASFEPVDLAALTTDLVQGFSEAATRAGLALELDLPALPEQVFVDRDLWEKIVLNLVSNALKFTFEGAITVSLRQDGPDAVLRVRDTGTGIDADELPHVFERFRRVTGARGRSHEGSGIGLALAHDLVSLHHGSLTAQSAPGVGSTFTVRVPLGSAHLRQDRIDAPRTLQPTRIPAADYVVQDADREPREPQGAQDASTRILVADDNADMRAYLERLLAPHWSVQLCADGEQALAAVRAQPPDLVLTDVMMPKLDGLGLLRALRNDPSTSQVPVVLLSARAGEEASVEGLDSGADDYLVKPFAARELLARVRVHLELARSRAQAAAALERASIDRQAREEAARFERLADETTDFVGLADPEGRVLYVNRAGRAMLGIGEDEDVTTTTVPDYSWPVVDGAPGSDRMAQVLRDGVWRGETLLQHRDGRAVPTSQVLVVHRHDDGSVAFFATIARDMTLEREASTRLRAAEERFRHAFEDAPVGMAILDGSLHVERTNPALCKLLGQEPETLLRTPLLALVVPDDRELTTRSLTMLVQAEASTLTWQVSMLRSDGELIAVTLAASPTQPSEAGRQILVHVLDVTERQDFERQLQHLADHDPLTGLLNRRRLMEQLDREIAAVHRYGGTGALLLLDLDDFKYVNDSLGHAAGDQLIVRTTHQLAQRLRETDTLARLGGDEFAVILPHVDEAGAREVGAELLETLHGGAAIVSNTGARRLSASIGISVFDHRRGVAPTSAALLVEADTAMYDAKEAGRGRIAVFDPANARQTGMEVHLDAAERLREALDAGRLVLHAQPIVALREATVPHYELLVRIRMEDGTLIAPAGFLEAAERFHLMRTIDRWVITEALRLLVAVQALGRRATLSVNLSVQSILDPELPDWIADSIAASGVSGTSLVFEVTETDAAVNFERANQLTRRLSQLGCGFALDDFGTGYCSLRYLKHLSFDYLKIDAEFVRSLLTSAADQIIVRAAVDIAHGLGKQTVAEGVEDSETLALLGSFGVDHVQGFHVAEPAPASEVLLGNDAGRVPNARRPRHEVPGAR